MTNKELSQRLVNKSEFGSMVGKKIKHYRSKADLTLRELAIQTEYTAGYISLLEKGEGVPNTYVLVQLANALGIPVSYLIGEKEIYDKELNIEKDPFFKNPNNKEYLELAKFIARKGIKPAKLKDTIKFLEKINKIDS